VIKPYHNNLPGGYLRLKKDDIVIVEHDKTKPGSSLRYGHKVPYNHQNGGGWFDESCLKKCDIPIKNLTGVRYLTSSTPLRPAVDLSRSSSGSITSSISSCSSSVKNSVRNEEKSIIWFLFRSSGDQQFWPENGHFKPESINVVNRDPKHAGDGNYLLCLNRYTDSASGSWNDVLDALNEHITETMRLTVKHNEGNLASDILNGINEYKSKKAKTKLTFKGKEIGYLYKANSTDEFGNLMKNDGHISENAHNGSFEQEDNEQGKVFCLYNSIASQFGFLAYQYNCSWMAPREKNKFTGFVAKTLKKAIEIDNRNNN